MSNNNFLVGNINFSPNVNFENNLERMIKEEIKQEYVINIEGCDDNNVFKISLTNKEKDFLLKLAAQSIVNSKCDCEPIIKIYDMKNVDNTNEKSLKNATVNAKELK